MVRQIASTRIRRGGFIIEAVVATALFGTAVIAFGRLTQTAATLSVQADERLAARLAAQNAIVRLRAVSLDQIDDQRAATAAIVGKTSHFDVQIDSETFQAQEANGVHLIVRVASPGSSLDQDHSRAIATLHDWRIDRPVDRVKVDPTDSAETDSAEQAEASDE